MKMARMRNGYLASLVVLALLFCGSLVASYSHLLGLHLSAGEQIKYAYLAVALGLVLLVGQGVLVFRSLISGLLLQERAVAELSERLSQMSVIDELTKAFNKAKFEIVITREVENARRYNSIISGMMFDVDGFKALNDQHGYKTGDRILYELARFISKHIRKTDYLFRWRGGKFIILAPHIDVDKAATFSEKLRQAVEAKGFGDGIKVTISLGVTQISTTDTPEAFIHRIQAALASAKATGRNRSIVSRAA